MDSTTQSIKKLYYSIGEVSKATELKQYVLRYWETEFKPLSPSKNKAGNRTYRQKDIDTIQRIKDLLYRQKFTIEGARKMLSNENTPESKTIEEQPKQTGEANVEILIKIRSELKSLLENINS